MAAIYLDWNSTAPILPEVSAAMAAASGELWGNPASVHAAGRRARAQLETTREQLAEWLGFSARDVLFTSGGTEANNLALAHVPALLTSRIEHPSVTRMAEQLAALGRPVVWLAVTPGGQVTAAAVEQALHGLAEPRLATVAVMAANHETGVLQPLPEIARVVRAAGARLHVDAVQLLGKADHTVLEHADSVAMAGHKLRGPKGIGALLFRGTAPAPLLVGGAQERGLRPGTQDAVAALGLQVALAHCKQLAGSHWPRVAALRAELEQGLLAWGQLNGDAASRVPHVSNVSIGSFPGPELVAALDLLGVCVASGSACSAGTTEPSAVIQAMLGSERARCALRFSLGESSTSSDVAGALQALRRLL